MTRIRSILLTLVLLTALMAAGCSRPESPSVDTAPTPAQTTQAPAETTSAPAAQPSEEPASVPETRTVEDFCADMAGVWVAKDHPEHSFDFCIFEGNTFVTGTYPGEYGRLGEILDVYPEDDRLTFTVFFKEEDRMGDHYEASVTNFSITVTGPDEFLDTTGAAWLRKGADLNAAIAAVFPAF